MSDERRFTIALSVKVCKKLAEDMYKRAAETGFDKEITRKDIIEEILRMYYELPLNDNEPEAAPKKKRKEA